MPINTALLSDIHGNSAALQAVLAYMQHQACTQVFMLGDIINGVDPHGCIQLLREWCETNDNDFKGADFSSGWQPASTGRLISIDK